MFARVSIYEIPVDGVGEAANTFGRAIHEISTMSGLVSAHVLVHTESGRVITMTFWGSAGDMEASRVTGSRLRSEAVRALDGAILSTEEYEVAATEHGDLT